MWKKYVILAVCAALVVVLIQTPEAQAKKAIRPTNHAWVRIDEVEGYPWNDVAIYPGTGEQGDRQYFMVFVPFFNISIPLFYLGNNSCTNSSIKLEDRVGIIGHTDYNKWRSRYDRRFD